MRFEAWERRLNAVLDKHSRVPFAWGKADCCAMTAECVWALTQRDLFATWRGRCSDEATAAAIFAEHGSLRQMAEAALAAAGLPVERIPIAMAQRGDPCITTFDNLNLLAVVMGGEIVAKGMEGLRRLPLSAGRFAWAIR